MKRSIMLFVVLLGVIASYAIDIQTDKYYKIECMAGGLAKGAFVTDDGTTPIKVVAGNDERSAYWQFVASTTDGCYYIKNVHTGKYVQAVPSTEGAKLVTGDDPVDYIFVDCTASDSKGIGITSADRDPKDFTSTATIAWNWDETNRQLQCYKAQAGTNHKSFWTLTAYDKLPVIDVPTSPFTGVAPSEIKDGGRYYLYNVESGLWLQNNDRIASDWSTRGQVGVRGLDFQLNASGDGYLLDAGLGKKTINRENYYLDNDVDHVWVFGAVDGSVSNAVTIKSATRYLTVKKDTPANAYNNAYNAGTPGQPQWYLNNPENDATNGTWQIISREERLAKMIAAGKTEAQDATWMILSPDFGNNNTRWRDNWVKEGTWVRGGDADGNWGRGSMIIESWNSGAANNVYQTIQVPNGIYAFTLQGFYRDGKTVDIGAKHNAGTVEIRAFYYANEVEKPLRSVIDGHTSAVLGPDRWRVNTDGWYVPDNMADCSRCMNISDGYHNEDLIVNVTTGSLKIGVKKTGGVEGDWVIFDNMQLTYLGPIDLSEVLASLNSEISKAEAFEGVTTDAIQARLDAALEAAKAALTSEDGDAISDATAELNAALTLAKEVDVFPLRRTCVYARGEGVDISEEFDYLMNGTTNRVDELLRVLRNKRKLNAIEKVDISLIECSEPKNEEADYYLYNVGAGIFFSTTADWGTHIALDNPGMLIHFRPDGEWGGAPGRPVFHLSGNGWNGMNWEEEYWDKNGDNKLALVPVEGKDKVYNLCEWDNYNWHFVYDVKDDVCDNNTHYWNSVQKRDWNRNDYKDNPYAQWMLVSPAAYEAAMDKANEEKPLDVTFKIQNPNITKAKVNDKDNWDRGWQGLGTLCKGQDREPWRVIEWFERDADMSQTIEGLKPGKYEVTCYGFYRDGSSDHEAEKVKNGEKLIQNAYLVANDEQVALCNVTSAADKMPGVGETRDGVDGAFACWPWQANEYFQTGLYKNTLPVEVGADGKLTIGIKSSYNGELGSWIVVGNFRLTCIETKVPVEVGETGYATWIAPMDVIFDTDDNVKAYAAQVMDGYVHLAQVDEVPAGTAVVLKAEEGSYAISKYAGANLAEDNDLQAATTAVEATGTQYVLANIGGEAGFAKAATGTSIPAGKGYLIIAAGAETKAFLPFGDDNATAIDEITAQGAQLDAPIFNLAGQRVNKADKGVYIYNGKKVLK